PPRKGLRSAPERTKSNPSRVSCECPSVERPPYSPAPRLAPLLPPPERAEGAVLALREVLPFLVRAAHAALAHRHGLDAVLDEEALHLRRDPGVRRHVRGHPALDDRLGAVVEDHAGGDLRGRPVVGAVQGHGADRVFGRLPARTHAQVALDALSVAPVLVLLAAAAGTGGVAGELLAGHVLSSSEPVAQVPAQ